MRISVRKSAYQCPKKCVSVSAFLSGRGLRPNYPIPPIRVWGGCPCPLGGAGNPGIKYSLPGRKSNGMIQHLPSQTDECKLQLCYSPPQIEGAKHAGNLNTYQARVWAAAR